MTWKKRWWYLFCFKHCAKEDMERTDVVLTSAVTETGKQPCVKIRWVKLPFSLGGRRGRHGVSGCGGRWWQKDGRGQPGEEGLLGWTLMTGSVLWELSSAQAPWGRGVSPGLCRGQHTRRPFLHLWTHHRHLIPEMHLWRHIVSRQSCGNTLLLKGSLKLWIIYSPKHLSLMRPLGLSCSPHLPSPSAL